MKLSSAFVIVRNKTFQLLKRSHTPTAPWYVRLQVKGVRTTVSTKTADLLTAQHRATGFIEAALDGDLSPIHSQTSPRASSRTTVAEIIASINASEITSASRYADALVKLITLAKSIPHVKALTQPAKILNAELVNSLQLDADPESHGSLNALLINAKAVFSKTALTHYEKHNLPLPDLEPFLTAPLLPDASFRYSDQPISPKQLRTLATLKIPPSLRTLHSLVSLCGLTTHEATHATAKDFAHGGIFFPRFPLPPEIPLPRKGPAIPLASDAKRTALVNAYKTLLSPLNLSPLHLRYHAGYRWLCRSNSLDAAALFLNITRKFALYHFNNLPSNAKPLSWDEFLGK